jgi:uncharacterized protein with HEPN domain
MTEPHDIADSIDDILSAAKKAQAIIIGLDFESFQLDDRTTFAVVRALEILGEATKTDTASVPRPTSIRTLAGDGGDSRSPDPRL